MNSFIPCMALGTIFALPLTSNAEDAPPPAAAISTSTDKPPAEAPLAAQKTPAPIFLGNARLYVERALPVTAPDAAPLDFTLTRLDVERMMSQVRLHPPEDDTLEVLGQIEVRQPNIPPGPFAVFWALRHPTQAWRIFTPVQ